MAKILCKMCGGTIEVAREEKSCECPYCGSLVTVPRLDSDVKERLYARAEHFRQTQNFEKALATYEEIAKQDASDPEIFWGIVLSRFGIEYVEDPRSRERIPTCHRVQFDSILQDADYLEALELAAGTPEREIYEREAKRIAEIQREILKISAQEKPYDVFISFKEKTDAGTRTRDAVDAQEIYGRLTRAGLRVFFAPISLEGKLGQHYEPFIFAALNSARVMVVIGSKVEYFNAPWVRNEWGRFLALLKKDRSRLLIPCFKDITAYDLPEELSMFQALDMAKLGFVQDLQHVIEKTVARSREREVGGNEISSAGTQKFGNKIKRIEFAISEEEWEKADEFCEQCLDIDLENSQIYLYKTQIELRCGNADLLFAQDGLWASKNFQRAERFCGNDAIARAKIAEIKEKHKIFLEKSRIAREIMAFADGKFWEFSSEEKCLETLKKAEFFSAEDLKFFPGLTSAKNRIANFLKRNEAAYSDFSACADAQKFLEALNLSDDVKLPHYRDFDEKMTGVRAGIYNAAIQARERGEIERAIALFSKLSGTQNEIRECRELLKIEREKAKRPLVEFENGSANKRKPKEKAGTLSQIFSFAILFSIIALFLASGNAGEDKTLPLIFLAIFLLLMLYAPINLTILWLKGKIKTSDFVLSLLLGFVFDAIVAGLALFVMY